MKRLFVQSRRTTKISPPTRLISCLAPRILGPQFGLPEVNEELTEAYPPHEMLSSPITIAPNYTLQCDGRRKRICVIRIRSQQIGQTIHSLFGGIHG